MGKLKLIGILLFLAWSFNAAVAQNYKFGKVSKEELLEKSYPEDSTAHAAVLYENKSVSVEYNSATGFELITEVFKRIKLYDKDGFEYATEKVFLYKSGSNEEKLNGLKATTFSWIDNAIVETKLKKDGIFEEEYSENYDTTKFTMPALTEGSIIEFKYKIISPFLGVIDRIPLQYEIPMKKQEVKVSSPEYYNYKKFTSGYLPINLKESTHNDKITSTSKTRSVSTGFSAASTSYSQNTLDFVVNDNSIQSENVPAFKDEPYSGNSKNYISSISYELSFVKFPNQAIEYRSTTWEDVVKKIYESPSFGNELKKTNYYKEDIDKVLEGITSPTEKVAAIYSFVKSHMTWNKKHAVVTREGVKKAYREKTGNAAEINLMLTSMLTYAKINANPVVVSTSDRVFSLFPTLNGFNYVITRVYLPDGEIMYLDATDKFGLPNILPDRVLRGVGRLIDKTGKSEMVTFRSDSPSKKGVSLQCEIDSHGTLKGQIGIRRLHYNAHDFRIANAAKSEEALQEKFAKKYGINDIESYTVKGKSKLGNGVTEKCSFILENQAEVIENELFFSPLLFLRDKENIFKSNERNYPIDFGHGYANSYMVNIKIPEGYQVTETPKAEAFKLPDNMGSFSYRVGASNGSIQIIVNEVISTSMINSHYYPALKEFYNQIIQKENEQVVLKRI